MKIDFDSVFQFKELIENGAINNIIKFAQKAYPNECCGFILENGAVFPAHNVIESLYDSSLTSKSAFLIDDMSWKIASSNKSPIACIYHSHTNGDPDMSKMDRQSLRWSNLCYLIIGLIDTNPVSSKLFWWDGPNLQQLDIKI